MANIELLTADQVRQLLDYAPDTGVLTWKARAASLFKASGRRTAQSYCDQWNRRYAGQRAGSSDGRGYRQIDILGKNHNEHIVIWLWMTGGLPDADIDHKRIGRAENKWENLRDATRSDNLCNRGAQSNNKSGLKGVSTHKSGGFVAAICKEGKRRYLGYFKTAQAAHERYVKELESCHGEFARAS